MASGHMGCFVAVITRQHLAQVLRGKCIGLLDRVISSFIIRSDRYTSMVRQIKNSGEGEKCKVCLVCKMWKDITLVLNIILRCVWCGLWCDVL